MTYGSTAWLFTNDMKQKLNGVNSKMVSQVTKRTIHDEAREPSFNVVEYVLEKTWSYLRHILRLDAYGAVRRFLLELSAAERPFIPGTLLADTPYETVAELVDAASDRDHWKALWRDGRE